MYELKKKAGRHARRTVHLLVCLAILIITVGQSVLAKSDNETLWNEGHSLSVEPAGLSRLPDQPKRKPATRTTRRKTPPRSAAATRATRRKPTGTNAVRKVPSRTPKGPQVLTMPLFGARYARVTVKDQQLSGSVYYLASGHGGPDPGAVGKYGKYALAEDEYAYDVTIRLARVLMEHGAKVYMIVQDPNDGIRDTGVLPIDYDEVAYPRQTIPRNQTARLKQGTLAVNNLYARHKKSYQRSIVIHVDSRSIGQTIDVFFYHHNRSPAGQKLARHIHRTFGARYKRAQPGRAYLGTVSTRNTLYVVKNTTPPTVFIELGNIQNDKDQRRFVIPDNRQALANWLYEGIRTDYRSR
ncbi:MAG: N-acetylmuramoyl-L-alanine amidase [Bacteroidetes bacterium]|nr:N-acetylmuramoyl-L-alanine amidase [Fibrella sp.]